RRRELETASRRLEIVHDPHTPDLEAASERIAVDAPRAIGHLHAVAGDGTCGPERRIRDAVPTFALRSVLVEERAQRLGKTYFGRFIAPREPRFPPPAAQVAHFEQNLRRADITRQDHPCPPVIPANAGIHCPSSSSPPSASRW